MGTWTSTTYESGGVVHLSCAETAKLVRKALKAAFPGQKFSVRSDSYSMGASIHISWTDGPTGAAVDDVVGVYAGARFDGMVDLKTYNRHWIEPDGTVSIATSGGGGSTLPEVLSDPPTANSKEVSLGADYILTQRTLSPEVTAKIEQEISDYMNEPFPANGGHSVSLPVRVFKADDGGALLALDTHESSYAGNLVWQIGCQRDYSTACDCPATSRYYSFNGTARCAKCGA